MMKASERRAFEKELAERLKWHLEQIKRIHAVEAGKLGYRKVHRRGYSVKAHRVKAHDMIIVDRRPQKRVTK